MVESLDGLAVVIDSLLSCSQFAILFFFSSSQDYGVLNGGGESLVPHTQLCTLCREVLSSMFST